MQVAERKDDAPANKAYNRRCLWHAFKAILKEMLAFKAVRHTVGIRVCVRNIVGVSAILMSWVHLVVNRKTVDKVLKVELKRMSHRSLALAFECYVAALKVIVWQRKKVAKVIARLRGKGTTKAFEAWVAYVGEIKDEQTEEANIVARQLLKDAADAHQAKASEEAIRRIMISQREKFSMAIAQWTTRECLRYVMAEWTCQLQKSCTIYSGVSARCLMNTIGEKESLKTQLAATQAKLARLSSFVARVGRSRHDVHSLNKHWKAWSATSAVLVLARHHVVQMVTHQVAVTLRAMFCAWAGVWSQRTHTHASLLSFLQRVGRSRHDAHALLAHLGAWSATSAILVLARQHIKQMETRQVAAIMREWKARARGPQSPVHWLGASAERVRNWREGREGKTSHVRHNAFPPTPVEFWWEIPVSGQNRHVSFSSHGESSRLHHTPR
jgi:hypothetical protein